MLYVIRGSVTQTYLGNGLVVCLASGPVASTQGATFFAQARWTQPVIAHKRGIKTPQTGKTSHVGDVSYRQLCVGQQLLGGQQAAGLQVLQRRDTKLRLKNTSQMAVAHTQARRQFGSAGGIGSPRVRLVQQAGGLQAQRAAGILNRPGKAFTFACSSRPI